MRSRGALPPAAVRRGARRRVSRRAALASAIASTATPPLRRALRAARSGPVARPRPVPRLPMQVPRPPVGVAFTPRGPPRARRGPRAGRPSGASWYTADRSRGSRNSDRAVTDRRRCRPARRRPAAQESTPIAGDNIVDRRHRGPRHARGGHEQRPPRLGRQREDAALVDAAHRVAARERADDRLAPRTLLGSEAVKEAR